MSAPIIVDGEPLPPWAWERDDKGNIVISEDGFYRLILTKPVWK